MEADRIGSLITPLMEQFLPSGVICGLLATLKKKRGSTEARIFNSAIWSQSGDGDADRELSPTKLVGADSTALAKPRTLGRLGQR
jgi:hypothetical protein